MTNDTYWIVKPVASSQGRGIFLTNNTSEIPKGSYIVSQYLDNPLLIDGYKFDLRIYVAITSINPLRIYMYDEGLVRFATEKYSNTNQDNKFAHLTNYSINKYSENYVDNRSAKEDFIGSKRSLSYFRSMLQERNISDTYIFDKINDIVIKTIISIEELIKTSFEAHVPYRNN
jgi:tubulin polyglutamylase TTLL5